MKEHDATEEAGAIIRLILQHQPNALPTSALNDPNSGKQIAMAIAELRKTLIAELQKQ